MSEQAETFAPPVWQTWRLLATRCGAPLVVEIRAAEMFACGWTATATVEGHEYNADRRGEDASAAVLQVASDIAYDLDTEGAEIVAPGCLSRDEFARMSEVWSLRSIVETLAEATEHALNDHDCDAHGHERFRYAADAAREWLAKVLA